MITRRAIFMLVFPLIMLGISGCLVRTYEVTRDRVDQGLERGNRGFVEGQSPGGEIQERKKTRTTQVVEVEFSSPLKFERRPKQRITEEAPARARAVQPEAGWGNRGFITQSYSPPVAEEPGVSPIGGYESYTVKEGDTLEKISKKFYGTVKKWNRIYEANRDVLKRPDRIYTGQVINVPVEGMEEPLENLK